ncbi:MAG: hypothetical protein HY754_01955, partial [Nitrospirae bacterium]|nr:hypothetical protein [Nitrospirota bacterium]
RQLTTGKKIFSRPFVGGGLIEFTAFEPTSDVCSLGGNTHLISLHYTTGTPYNQPALLACNPNNSNECGTSGVTTDLTINASVNLGTGVPPMGESLVALPLSGDTYKVITQVSGGLPGTGISSSEAVQTGYILWLSK